MYINDGEYITPSPEGKHSSLVKRAISKKSDLCIVTPTVKPEFLDYHALQALFELMGEGRGAVMVVTGNTSVRERFSQFRLGPDGIEFSKRRWPVVSVKSDGSVAEITSHYKNKEGPPGLIFSKFSTRLPDPSVSKHIGCVLYDATVTFDWDRWDRFQKWRRTSGIPSVVYFVRNPLGEVYDQVKDKSTVWGWNAPALKTQIKDADIPTESSLEAQSDPNSIVPECTPRQQEQLENLINGIDYEVQVSTTGRVVQELSVAWKRYQEFEELVEAVDTPFIQQAAGRARRTIAALSRVPCDLELYERLHAKHAKASAIAGRISSLSTASDQFSGDDAVGRGPLDKLIKQLEAVRAELDDADPSYWKRGAVVSAVQRVHETNERLLIVVPNEPTREALVADLRLNFGKLYSKARSQIDIRTSSSLPSSRPADYLLLTGPPRYRNRWMLRSSHAPKVSILTYPHELPLLYSQVRSLNNKIRETTHPKLVEAVEKSRGEGSDLAHLTIGLEVPFPDELGEGSGEFEGQELLSREKEDVDDIIQSEIRRFRESNNSDIEYGEKDISASEKSGSEPISGCYDIIFKDGYAIYLKPSNKISVVNPKTQNTVRKRPANVVQGDVVVTVENKDALRAQLESILLDRGDIDILVKAQIWKDDLQTEIESRGHSLDEFKSHLQDSGVDVWRGTYKNWYEGDVSYTKKKQHMRQLAEAYDLETVLNNFEDVWNATQRMKRMQTRLVRELRKRAHLAIADNEDEIVLSDKYDIRLSDFETTDEGGEEYVQSHVVKEIRSDVEASPHQINVRRSYTE